jgi:hypothetical protein
MRDSIHIEEDLNGHAVSVPLVIVMILWAVASGPGFTKHNLHGPDNVRFASVVFTYEDQRTHCREVDLHPVTD